jgi:mRNA interferase MazF
MFKQGDIVSVSFPFTNVSEFRKRPALVISNEKVNQTGDYLLVQITSKHKKDGLSLALNDDDYSNLILPLKSYVRFHKIFLLNEALINKKVSSVTNNFRISLIKRITELIN